jgi:glutaredoxin
MTDDQLGIVTMYFKKGCPHCANASKLLEEKYNLKVKYVDVESSER